MEEPRRDEEQQTPPNRSMFRGSNLGIIILILGIAALIIIVMRGTQRTKISYSALLKQIDGLDVADQPLSANSDFLKELEEKGIDVPELEDGDDQAEAFFCNIESMLFSETQATGRFKVAPFINQLVVGDEAENAGVKRAEIEFFVNLPRAESETLGDLRRRLLEKGVQIDDEKPDNAVTYIYLILSGFIILLILMMWVSYRRSQNQMLGGGGFLSGFSKSPAKRYEAANQPITFKDVAGLEGVKADLQEIVDYLTDPKKFQRLGGRVPKGVLLNGPPGTGKTLLARAIAGEANVPFYSVNGSEFIQMFVGVGASRVRDLFKTAKEHAPAIIFIDEIDAVGRQRGAGLGGGHDEREQTLNQILGEMDGFVGTDSVIVVAATNRPDVLDPALLRPGRFDRHITVNRPTQKGRLEVFKVHVRDVPLASNVDLKVLAAGSVGLTGADIRNIVNEAALWAARHDKNKVEMADFEYARDKVLMGAKREEVLTEREKEKTAYHEAGHTLAAWHLKGAYPVHKVTIIPRGQALGVTHMLPGEDRMNMSESEIRDQLVVLLAGRAAERIIYDEVTVGAENDLERATSIARRMVTSWGMSARLGPVSYKLTNEDPFLGREIHQQRQFSEHTMELIDEEVVSLLREAAEKANSLLEEKRQDLEDLTESLVREEELGQAEIEAVIGPSVHGSISKKNSSESDSTDSESEAGPRNGDEGGETAASDGGTSNDGQSAATEDATAATDETSAAVGRDSSPAVERSTQQGMNSSSETNPKIPDHPVDRTGDNASS